MRLRPSDLAFGSFLVYPSPGASPELARYKATVLGIRQDRVRSDGERWSEYATGDSTARDAGGGLRSALGCVNER